MPLASLTSTITSLLEHHGALAVFAILAVDAILPVGGELPMILSGAVAAGAVGDGHGTSVLGAHVAQGLPTFVVLALAGTLGYLAGALAGWAIGRQGGRELVERHGRWLHLGPHRMERAERWFDRHGPKAVLLGRVTPIVRSFISVSAGVLRAPLPSYVALTALGSAIWCFGLAGIGWALGSRWDTVHHAFRYVDAAALVGVAGVVAVLVLRRRGAASV